MKYDGQSFSTSNSKLITGNELLSNDCFVATVVLAAVVLADAPPAEHQVEVEPMAQSLQEKEQGTRVAVVCQALTSFKNGVFFSSISMFCLIIYIYMHNWPFVLKMYVYSDIWYSYILNFEHTFMNPYTCVFRYCIVWGITSLNNTGSNYPKVYISKSNLQWILQSDQSTKG